MEGVARVAAVLGSIAVTLGFTAAPATAGQIRAGVGKADASWHVGASAGQYASGNALSEDEFDPNVQSFKNLPSYGVQARLTARALVVSDGTRKLAVVKNDLYIPQDALWRRVAQLLEAAGTGIGRENLTMAVTHSHSSPYYTSTAWGAWTFQDIFDPRAYDHFAKAMAQAVIAANERLVPVRVGAGVVPFDATSRNALGPALADDGTPAGFPDSYTDRDLTIVRFDDVSDPRRPRPLANLLNFGLHGENLDGNDLISADWVGPAERMLDRSTGALTVVTQNAVGNAENERGSFHPVAARRYFDHRQYGQAEYNASLIVKAAVGVWKQVGRGAGRVPFFTDGPVAMADRWFPGPLTHPFPTVSNCRTGQALAGDPQVPIVGLPDCRGPQSAFGEVGLPSPVDPGQNPGPSMEDVKALGIPVPDSLSFPSTGALEEDTSVHLQAFRIGPILFTVCSCEQWADQSRNIKSRTDTTAGNQWMGFDWTSYRGLDDTGVECFAVPPYDGGHWSCPHPDTARTAPCTTGADGTWDCPDPRRECLVKGLANTCRGTPADARLTGIPDAKLRRVRAQVRSCANGWNAPDWAPYAESEPADVAQIKGAYTCDDDARSAALGYALTVPISMANDYNGYIATYREYQRGDHYRKALTGWGPHSSDYMATRLVKLGRLLNGGPPLDQKLDGTPDPDADQPALEAKTQADLAATDAKVQALGQAAEQVARAYTAALPDDGGTPGAVTQPKDVERFAVSAFTWRGGSNYTDNPIARVERYDAQARQWRTFADETGEVPVTVRYPAVSQTPAYLSGGQEWHWTAWFEAFASRYDLPGSPRATPAGRYRFAVSGHHRAGGEARPYRLVSAEFTVSPWRGLTAEDLRRERSGRISVRVGPSRTVKVPGGRPDTATLGPVDYPDSWGAGPKPRFIDATRSVVRDPAAPQDPARMQWFCLACSFRPWADTGRASSVTVTFTRRGRVVARARAFRWGDRWLTRRTLRRGERAVVRAGAVHDRFGNVNGAASNAVRRR